MTDGLRVLLASLGLRLRENQYSNGCVLEGARHAVLGTLYSRAHRIGLDGDSWLLHGLRNGLSLRLFLVVVVIVLAYPALEFLVLAE